jgi:hypothetical protein
LAVSFQDKNASKLEGSTRKEIIKEGFLEALIESILSKDFNVERILNDESTNRLKKVFTPNELQEIKEEFSQIKDKLILSIEKFPK